MGLPKPMHREIEPIPSINAIEFIRDSMGAKFTFNAETTDVR